MKQKEIFKLLNLVALKINLDQREFVSYVIQI